MCSRLLIVAGMAIYLTIALPAQDEANSRNLLCVIKRDGNADIFSMNADGAKAINLTKNPGQDLFPAWAPDGKKIAFASDRDAGHLQLYVMDADGGHVKRLTTSDNIDRAPAWSPDGKRLVFCRHIDGNPEIFVMNADGSDQKNLSNSQAYDADPAWSPDGRKIAFASNRDADGFNVFLMDADGGNVRQITERPNPFGFVYPAWRPDGKAIAYADLGDNAVDIFLQDLETGKRTRLTKQMGLNTCAAFSPDGKRLAFMQVDAADLMDMAGSLYVMDADGMNTKAVERRGLPTEGGRPAWKPK